MKKILICLLLVALMGIPPARASESEENLIAAYAGTHVLDDDGKIVLKVDTEPWIMSLLQYWLKVDEGERLTIEDLTGMMRIMYDADTTAVRVASSDDPILAEAGRRMLLAHRAMSYCSAQAMMSAGEDASMSLKIAMECGEVFWAELCRLTAADATGMELSASEDGLMTARDQVRRRGLEERRQAGRHPCYEDCLAGLARIWSAS